MPRPEERVMICVGSTVGSIDSDFSVHVCCQRARRRGNFIKKSPTADSSFLGAVDDKIQMIR